MSIVAFRRKSTSKRGKSITGRASLLVEHVITADDPFGEPWPPDGNCSLVRRTANGFSLWRRLRLTEQRAIDGRQAARRYEQLRQSRQHKEP
jgi:hypothetical protein